MIIIMGVVMMMMAADDAVKCSLGNRFTNSVAGTRAGWTVGRGAIGVLEHKFYTDTQNKTQLGFDSHFCIFLYSIT